MGSYRETVEHQEAHIFVENFAKIYPSGKIKVFQYSKPFYKRKEGFELHEPELASTTVRSTEASSLGSDERSLRRSKTLISDIVLCTEFDMFATFTFKQHRFDIGRCKTKMSEWLHSQQKQWGKFQYLIVPEFHKDKKAIHFHALLKNYKGTLRKTKYKINNRTAYNITSYQKGFSTVILIDNVDKVASYVKKYITKDMPSLGISTQKFWTSQGLPRPELAYNIDTDRFNLSEVYTQSFYKILEGVVD